jgi:glycerate 2-kinase
VKTQRILRTDAALIWTAALRAVDPESALHRFVKRRGRELSVQGGRFELGQYGKVWVLGAGKAAAPMGQAVENILGKYLAGGLLVTKYGHGLPLKKIEIVEAGHPLPDKNSLAAGDRIIALAESQIRPGDLVFCLFSGGASSLLVSPAEGIQLEDKLLCTRLLLEAGATIHELNAVRKHLSRIKGGGFARLLARTDAVSLILSDVVGDDLGTIASGPMAADTTTFGDCIEILEKLRVWSRIPGGVKQRLIQGAAGKIRETPKPGDTIFRKIRACIIGNSAQACAAAAREARRLGYKSMVLTSSLEGDTGEAARFHMSIIREIVSQKQPLGRPACVISGGETTVKVAGKGTGGRNQEFALHCARALASLPAPCVIASLGTDGTDGPTDAAGAFCDNSTLTRSMRYGSHFLTEALLENNSHYFFERLGDLIVTGPTRTNVMDLHILLVG